MKSKVLGAAIYYSNLKPEIPGQHLLNLADFLGRHNIGEIDIILPASPVDCAKALGALCQKEGGFPQYVEDGIKALKSCGTKQQIIHVSEDYVRGFQKLLAKVTSV